MRVYAGIPLEKAIRHFEKEAELGSNTCSYSLYDYQRIYLKPLYLELLCLAPYIEQSPDRRGL